MVETGEIPKISSPLQKKPLGVPREIRVVKENIVAETGEALREKLLKDFISDERFFKKDKLGRTILSAAGRRALGERLYIDRWGPKKRYQEARFGLKGRCGNDNETVEDVLESLREQIAKDRNIPPEERKRLKRVLVFLERVNREDQERIGQIRAEVRSELSLILGPDFPEHLVSKSQAEEVLSLRKAWGEKSIKVAEARREGDLQKVRAAQRERALLKAQLVKKYTRLISEGKRKRILEGEIPAIELTFKAKEVERLRQAISERRGSLKEKIFRRISELFPWNRKKVEQEEKKTYDSGRRRFLRNLALLATAAAIAVTIPKEVTGVGPLTTEETETPSGARKSEEISIEEPRLTLEERQKKPEIPPGPTPVETEQPEEEKKKIIEILKQRIRPEELALIEKVTEEALRISDKFFLDVGGQKVTPAFGEWKPTYGIRTREGKQILEKNRGEEGRYDLHNKEVQEQLKQTIFQFAKAYPEEMQKEINRRLKAQGVTEFKTREEAKKWLEEEGFMIDCAGAVSYVMDRLFKQYTGKSFYEATETRWGYVGPGTFTELARKGLASEVPDKIFNLRPGDVIALGNVHSMVVLGFQINEKTNKAVLLIGQSTNVAAEKNGYHVVAIKITNPDGGLSDQDWSSIGINVRALFEDDLAQGRMTEEQIRALELQGLNYSWRFTNGNYKVYRFLSLFKP